MTVPADMLALTLRQSGKVMHRSNTATNSEPIDQHVCTQRISVPQPRRDQVLIRVKQAAVNPSDMLYLRGEYGQSRVAGSVAGFEGTGTVVQTGSGWLARRLAGKRVSFVVGPRGSGSWAEYACADAATCIPVADGMRDEDAASFVVNPLTAAAMFELVKRSGSQSFVLNAAGSQLGKFLIKLAADSGYRPIAIVRRESTMDALRELGAQHVFHSTDPDFAAQLARRFAVENTRVFLDAVVDDSAATVFGAMPAKARWVIYGMLATSPASLRDAGHMIFLRKQIEGFWLSDWMRRASLAKKMATIRQAQQRFVDGSWQTEIAGMISLSEAVERLPQALADAQGKVLLEP